MKRFLPTALAAAVVACISPPAHAMKAAGKFGLTYAELTGDDADGFDMGARLGLTGGVVLFPSDNFGIDILYAQKGAEKESGGTTTRIEADYAQLNLTARVGSPSARFVVGGYVAQKIDKVMWVVETGSGSASSDWLDPYVKGTDYGVVAGVSLGARQVTFDATFELSLDTITEDSSDDMTNQVITAGVTFRF